MLHSGSKSSVCFMYVCGIPRECDSNDVMWLQVIFLPSHGEHKDPAVTRRVMDFMQFMNSKTLFTVVRKDSALVSQRPVTVHVNYHPDKHPRMLAVVRHYVDGDLHALDGFPDGSENRL